MARYSSYSAWCNITYWLDMLLQHTLCDFKLREILRQFEPRQMASERNVLFLIHPQNNRKVGGEDCDKIKIMGNDVTWENICKNAREIETVFLDSIYGHGYSKWDSCSPFMTPKNKFSAWILFQSTFLFSQILKTWQKTIFRHAQGVILACNNLFCKENIVFYSQGCFKVYNRSQNCVNSDGGYINMNKHSGKSQLAMTFPSWPY